MKKHTKEILKYPVDFLVHFIVIYIFSILLMPPAQAFQVMSTAYYFEVIGIISIVLVVAEIFVEEFWWEKS